MYKRQAQGSEDGREQGSEGARERKSGAASQRAGTTGNQQISSAVRAIYLGGGFAFDCPSEPEDLLPEAGGVALGEEFEEPPEPLLELELEPVFL